MRLEAARATAASTFVPAAPPPPGVTPNFENPRDVMHMVNWIHTGVWLGFIFLFCAIRLYVKVAIKTGPVLLEEYCFVIAWALTVFLGVTILFSTPQPHLSVSLLADFWTLRRTDVHGVVTHYGEGYHVWELSQETYTNFLKWLYISTVVYIPAAYATKATLLLLIARVFSVKEWVSKALRGFIIGLGIAYTPVQIAKIAICRPISRYWETTVDRNSSCLNQTSLFLADISLAVVTDFIILIVPIPLAMSMRALGTWQKCKIILLLSAGGAATATTVYRTVKIAQYIGSTDSTADFTILSIFTLLELSIGVICACLPSFSILLRALSQKKERNSPNVPRTAQSPRAGWRLHPRDTLVGSWWSSKLSRRTAATGHTTEEQAIEEHTEWASGNDSSERDTRPPINFEQELAIFCRGGFDMAALESGQVPLCDEEGRRNAPFEAGKNEGLPKQDVSLRMATPWKGTIWDGNVVVNETGSLGSPGPTSKPPDAEFRSKTEGEP